MSFAFGFDASACTGCKACQAACKDKNDLPVGVLWRRVIAISGGHWSMDGGAWVNSVFSYNYSLACNHCVHPKCAGVCPVNAYYIRADGIVILDSSKCIGCGYCNWACPYAVPQYNPDTGVMSKCNFCFDDLDVGRAPACVAACPMRVLDYEQVNPDEPTKSGFALWEVPGTEHPFPLPPYSRTQPRVRLTPHPAMSNTLQKSVANREEIKPGRVKSELPLVFFSLLAQTAVGISWALNWMPQTLRGVSTDYPLFLPPDTPTLLVGLFLGMAVLVSISHLGAKWNAWRALGNLRKSWLSREILSIGLFGTGWILSLVFPPPWLKVLPALLGLGLIYSMANVYRLRSVSAWNTWHTLASFLFSAVLLGQSVLLPVYMLGSGFTGIHANDYHPTWLVVLFIAILACEPGITNWGKKYYRRTTVFRISIILFLIFILAVSLVYPSTASLVFSILVFLLIGLEEFLGRWLLYAELEQRIL